MKDMKLFENFGFGDGFTEDDAIPPGIDTPEGNYLDGFAADSLDEVRKEIDISLERMSRFIEEERLRRTG